MGVQPASALRLDFPGGRIEAAAAGVYVRQQGGGKESSALSFTDWGAALEFFSEVAQRFFELGRQLPQFQAALEHMLPEGPMRDPRHWLAPRGMRLTEAHIRAWDDLDASFSGRPYTGGIERGNIRLAARGNGYALESEAQSGWSCEDLIAVTCLVLGHDRNQGEGYKRHWSPFLAVAIEQRADSGATGSPAAPLPTTNGSLTPTDDALQLDTQVLFGASAPELAPAAAQIIDTEYGRQLLRKGEEILRRHGLSS